MKVSWIVLGIIFILTLGISSVLVFAVSSGGGGNGGGGSNGGSGPYFTDFSCNDAGAISFRKNPQIETVNIINVNTNERFENVQGVWYGNYFESDDLLFIESEKYQLEGQDATTICPSFAFSCKLADITIKNCWIGDQLTAEFNTTNITNFGNLKYVFKAGKRTYTKTKTGYSTELKSLEIIGSENNYQLTLPGNLSITQLQISDTGCETKYDTFDVEICQIGEKPLDIKEEDLVKKENLMCADMITLEDRVRCRLNLPEEVAQRQNQLRYLPEECKAIDDISSKDDCIQRYKASSICWKDQPLGDKRFTCGRQIIGLKDSLQDDIQECRNKEDKSSCFQDLKEKVFIMHKFKFYDLEERAEELLEKGIDKTKITEFIIEMEKAKQEYNQDLTFSQRKLVILKIRNLWKDLVDYVKTEVS